MPIKVVCQCGARLKVDDNFAGRTGKCPACGDSIIVPEPETWIPAEPKPIKARSPLRSRRLAVAIIGLAIVAFAVAIAYWPPKREKPGLKAARAYIESVVENAIMGSDWSRDVHIGSTTVAALRDDPRRQPWMWDGYTLFKHKQQELVLHGHYQYNPATLQSRVVWIEMGNPVYSLERTNYGADEWSTELRAAVERAWDLRLAEYEAAHGSVPYPIPAEARSAFAAFDADVAAELGLTKTEIREICSSKLAERR
jgi:hypothetical protein